MNIYWFLKTLKLHPSATNLLIYVIVLLQYDPVFRLFIANR